MLFSNARNTGVSLEKTPSASSTISSRNNPATGNRGVFAADAQVRENLIHFLFHWVCEAERNRQSFTSAR